MKKLALFIFCVQTIYAIPVYEFFSKGSSDYYQTNTKNIFNFFDKKLNFPRNEYSSLLWQCQTQFSDFGFEIIPGTKVNRFAIKMNLDQDQLKEISFYCKVDSKVSAHVLKVKKLALKMEDYYYFNWNLLNSRLDVYALKKSVPQVWATSEIVSFDKLLPVHLVNIENKNIIYFGLLTDRMKKARVHTMVDINYPIVYNPEINVIEFSVIETNPLFFPPKTRILFQEFNKEFGIIPDRLILKNQKPAAVMP